MYIYHDYDGIPAVTINTKKAFRGIKLVRNKWERVSLADLGRKGYVFVKPDWEVYFKDELKDAPPIPIS